jgi:hypothetical protein
MAELDQTNKLSKPNSAADFLKDFNSPWSGLARSRRLSVGTQDTIRLLRTHTRETFDQVSNTSLTDALDSMDLDSIDCSNIPVFVDDGNNKKSEKNTYNNSDNYTDKNSSVSNIETKKMQNDTNTISVSSHNVSNKNKPTSDAMPSLSANSEGKAYIWKNKNNRGSGIQLGARLRKEIVENYNMLQKLPTVKHPIKKVTRFSMEKPRVILLKPDGISICKFKQKLKLLEETTFVPYETISEALLIDHTSILIQVNDYHDLLWKSNMAPTILSDIAVRLEIVSLLSQKREQLHTIESVAKHMYRWGVIDSKVLTKSNINIKDNDVYGVRENLIVRKTQSSALSAGEIDRRYANRKDTLSKNRSTSYFFFNRNGDKKKKGRGRNSLKTVYDDNSNSNGVGITNTDDKNMKIKDNKSLSGVPKPKLSLTRTLSYNALKKEANKERNKKPTLKEKNNPKKATSLRKSIIERMVEKIEDPVESQVRFYVQKIVYDQETDEGRTRMHFIEESKTLFQCIEKSAEHSKKGSLDRVNEALLAPLKKTRLFIDGMREYIIEHHEKELVHIVDEISTSGSSTSSLSTNAGEDLTTIEEESIDKRADILRLEAIVTKCAEQSIVKNLFPLILKNLEEIVTKDQTAKWLEQYSKLSLKPQSFFEIPGDHQCEMEWYEASLACADIGKSKTASEKMEALLDTARLIYERFHELKPKTVLGADDFMPIFMFVVSRGGLDRAFYDKEYLVHLCPANVLDGEGAYYLSTFEAALTFMLDMKV